MRDAVIRPSSCVALLMVGAITFLGTKSSAQSLWNQWLPAPKEEATTAFDASLLEAPKSVAIDSKGNKFVSLCLTGKIRKMAPNGTRSTFATLPLGAPPLTPCGPFVVGVVGVVGIAFDLSSPLWHPVAWRIAGCGRFLPRVARRFSATYLWKVFRTESPFTTATYSWPTQPWG